MAYDPTNWTNGSGEPINAENLNKIESGISDAHVNISNLDSNLASLKTTVAKKTVSADLVVVRHEKDLPSIKAGQTYGGEDAEYKITKEGYKCLGIVGFNFVGTGQSFQQLYALTHTDYGTAGSTKILYKARNNYSKVYDGKLITRTLWVAIR